jgi:hypothetical protein
MDGQDERSLRGTRSAGSASWRCNEFIQIETYRQTIRWNGYYTGLSDWNELRAEGAVYTSMGRSPWNVKEVSSRAEGPTYSLRIGQYTLDDELGIGGRRTDRF